MTKKEKEALKIIIGALENITKYHNKNLTKKQYWALDDCVECLKYVIDRKYKLLEEQTK